MDLLRRMKHENVIAIYDVYTNFGVIDMMLELCAGGSMRRGGMLED